MLPGSRPWESWERIAEGIDPTIVRIDLASGEDLTAILVIRDRKVIRDDSGPLR